MFSPVFVCQGTASSTNGTNGSTVAPPPVLKEVDNALWVGLHKTDNILIISDIYKLCINCTHMKHTSCKMTELEREKAKGGEGENRYFHGESYCKVQMSTN